MSEVLKLFVKPEGAPLLNLNPDDEFFLDHQDTTKGYSFFLPWEHEVMTTPGHKDPRGNPFITYSFEVRPRLIQILFEGILLLQKELLIEYPPEKYKAYVRTEQYSFSDPMEGGTCGIIVRIRCSFATKSLCSRN